MISVNFPKVIFTRKFSLSVKSAREKLRNAQASPAHKLSSSSVVDDIIATRYLASRATNLTEKQGQIRGAAQQVEAASIPSMYLNREFNNLERYIRPSNFRISDRTRYEQMVAPDHIRFLARTHTRFDKKFTRI